MEAKEITERMAEALKIAKEAWKNGGGSDFIGYNEIAIALLAIKILDYLPAKKE